MDSTLKRAASPDSSAGIQPTTPKRQRRTGKAESASKTNSAVTPKSPKKKNTPVWDDIPKEWTHDRCPFLELPVELLDKITGLESQLELQDHIALASTCRTLRDAYTDDVWKAFSRGFNAPYSGVNHIFSGGLEASQQQAVSDAKGKAKEDIVSVYSHREKVADFVNTARLTKTQATQFYKISDKELGVLSYEERPNPHVRRNGYPMKLYSKAQVRALALRIHGGPFGHAAHIKKRAEIAEKCKATRAKNGTTSKRKRPLAFNWQALSDAAIASFLIDIISNSETGSEFEYEIDP